jgi:lysine-specific demethylase 8
VLDASRQWPLSSADFTQLINARRPAIFRGVAKDWPCTRLWDDAYLREKVARRSVTVTRSKQAVYSVDPEKGHYAPDDMQPMAFGDFLDSISRVTDDGPRWYLHKHNIEQQLPELIPDIRTPEHIEGSAMLLTSLWMGPRGSVTPIHHDFSDNFFVEVRGRKRVVMYAPEPEQAFYRLPFRAVNGRSSWHISRVGSLDNVERDEFPQFERAQPIDVTVEQGDVLYIPSFYWHEVHSLDSPSMSLSYWWSQYTVQEIEEMIRVITRFVELHATATSDWQQLMRAIAGAQLRA